MRPPTHYCLQSFVFCNHVEELRAVLFEVEFIFNNALLIYVYPNAIEHVEHPVICYLEHSYHNLLILHQL